MEQNPTEEIPGMSKFQMDQLKLFLSNYESMKDQISMEMMGPVNEPMRKMLGVFIQQLREQLGEPEPFESHTATPEITSKSTELTVEIIDQMLARPGIKPEEIDRLLDERASIMAKKGENNNE
jgi:hypothetical protein